MSTSDHQTRVDALQRRIKQLEAELSAARQQQHVPALVEVALDLVEMAPDAILSVDKVGRILSANQSAANLTGYEIGELLALNIATFFAADDLERNPLRYDLLHAGQIITSERLLMRKNGSRVPIEMKSRMSPDLRWHSFIRDISVRYQIAEDLRLSEEKFSRAFQLNPDAIAINRMADGVYIEVNQGFTAILGYSEAEIIGRRSDSRDLRIWCRDKDRQRMLQLLREQGEINGFQANFRRKDGQPLIGLMAARLIEINKDPCILSISRDITEQVQQHEQQRKLEAQLLQTQKLESLGVLAGGIAHDFNNLLAAIIGNAELAKRRLNPGSGALINIERIEKSTERAADLARQMLAYSGKGKFVVERIDLNELLEEMLHMLEVSISKNAVLRLNLHRPLPSIMADATQIRQIVMNLVINASEAISARSGFISITTTSMFCDNRYLRTIWLAENLPAGHYTCLEIADTGCGMSKETLGKLFDPFFTTKFTGRGLGMSAVLGIVRGHQGAIRVYSEPGQGSTFKILFPTSEQPAALTEIETELSYQGSGKILLVDDEESVRDVGAEMLGELGFEVITATDGRDALNKLSEHADIRCVLLDLTMPHMDGEKCFRELRQRYPQLGVIMSSGYNEQEVTQKFIGKGLAGFIQKPYRLATLKKLLSNLLNLAK
ncbi:MAG: PAS domain S-box protein [Deltaproteobacteria bacterium]|nr:PAS domain S-box protein [Deltaproteobacteria bacterium]NCP03860.1 PAS domain S-box protein [Deltaproteobacteria bacterium]